MKDYFVYGNSKTFRDYLRVLYQFVDTLQAVMDQEKIEVRQMDPSRVSMILLSMPKHVFDEYYFKGQEPRQIHLDLDNDLVGKGKTPFRKIYKDERVRFDFDEETYSVQLLGDLKRSWTLPLLDEEFEVPPIPKIEEIMKATVILTVDGLMKVMDDLEDSEGFTITVERDQVIFSQKTDVKIYNVPLRKGSYALLKVDVEEEITSNYPVDYVKAFVNAVKPLCSVIKIRLGKDSPIEVQAMVPEDATLKLWCAPRIETE